MLEQPVRARFDPDGNQVVDVVINRGYHPAAIVARAGLPLRLVFRRDDGDACTERVVFSSPHVDRRLAATGSTTIELPAQPPGEVRFTCGMGRYRGRIELLAERGPSILAWVGNWSSRFETLGTTLVLWICLLPLIALLAVLALDGWAGLTAAGAVLIAWVAGCLWAFRSSTEST